MFGLSGVELSQGALRDPLQHLLREDPHQLPADVQGLKHAPVLVGTWTQQDKQAGSSLFIFIEGASRKDSRAEEL